MALAAAQSTPVLHRVLNWCGGLNEMSQRRLIRIRSKAFAIPPGKSGSRNVGSFREFLRERETLLPGPRQEDFKTDIEHYRTLFATIKLERPLDEKPTYHS